MANLSTNVRRFSSRRRRLDRSLLSTRLRNARGYDRIAGYFSSSLLEWEDPSPARYSDSLRP